MSFYAAFELLLVLMYSYVARQAGMARTAYGLQMLAAYTVLGSAMMALAMLLLYHAAGTTSSSYALLTCGLYAQSSSPVCMVVYDG